jgi:predicted transcriptional regulator
MRRKKPTEMLKEAFQKFHILGDALSLNIFKLLLQRAMRVRELAAELHAIQSTVSNSLRRLVSAGYVARTGRTYSANPDTLLELCASVLEA